MAINSTEAARLLASRRSRGRVTCEECGVVFEGTNRRRYCSDTCNVRAWRRRRQTPPEAAAPTVLELRSAPFYRHIALPWSHTAFWWESQVALANVRASLAKLRAAAARGGPRQLELAAFVAAGDALHQALVRHNALVSEARRSLARSYEHRPLPPAGVKSIPGVGARAAIDAGEVP
jgi:hypothetical protein